MKKLQFTAVLLLLAPAAHADPRDDVLSSLLRCSGINKTEARLACFDAIVPQAKGALVAPVPAAPPVPVAPGPQAQAVPQPPAPAMPQSPAPVRSPALVMGPGPVAQTPPAPVAHAEDVVPPPAAPIAPTEPPHKKGFAGRFVDDLFAGQTRPPQTTVAEFGSESIANHGDHANPKHREGDTVDVISARLVEYHFAEDGRLIVSLDNGQDWLESSGGEQVGRLSRSALHYSALIRRSQTGSYEMKLTGISRTIKVRRIQ